MGSVIENGAEENHVLRTTLDELLQQGALTMLQHALEVEVEDYVMRHRAARDEQGRALVVRNGAARARQLVTGAGTLEVRAPRVDDRRVDEEGERQRFRSEILPPYMRRAPKVSEVLPILYLRGLSTGDFRAALPVLLGEEATGLSPTAITRLTATWDAEYQAWRTRSLAETDYVYVWVDGVHFRSVPFGRTTLLPPTPNYVSCSTIFWWRIASGFSPFSGCRSCSKTSLAPPVPSTYSFNGTAGLTTSSPRGWQPRRKPISHGCWKALSSRVVSVPSHKH
jgi:hypothetical protein